MVWLSNRPANHAPLLLLLLFLVFAAAASENTVAYREEIATAERKDNCGLEHCYIFKNFKRLDRIKADLVKLFDIIQVNFFLEELAAADNGAFVLGNFERPNELQDGSDAADGV